MVEQRTTQFDNGGSIPTSPLQLTIKECRFRDIRHIFEQFHYKGGHMGGGITHFLSCDACNLEIHIANFDDTYVDEKGGN